MALTLLEPVTQTIQNAVRARLISLGYAGAFRITEAYPDDAVLPTSTMIVVSVADQGDRDEIELGGGLVEEELTYTLDVLGFGSNAEAVASNVARQIKELFPRYSWVSLAPFIAGDHMEVRSCIATRLNFQNAKVWQEHWHSITLVVAYQYVPS